ncbi:MAG: metallophosphoesterase [Dehalococcoidia bacterium]|nr:metallophosphoesterase [Dehalococcoidia bacterium]
MSRRPFRAVHTSDVHLGAFEGSDGHQRERRALMEAAFRNVVSLGNESSAEVLLIAGDFFDNDRISEATVEFAVETLRAFEGQVVLVPGNHDPMDEGSVYWRYDWEALVPRLHLFREQYGSMVHLDDPGVTLWGRAFLTNDWHFRPLEGLPVVEPDRWRIAMAHGHHHHDGEDMYRSLPIAASELQAAAPNWDYVALGHWEPHADVSVEGLHVVYSGAPLALSDANRKAGWASVVDFSEDGVSWRLEPVDPRRREAADAAGGQ